jgi:hypothetical protein
MKSESLSLLETSGPVQACNENGLSPADVRILDMLIAYIFFHNFLYSALLKEIFGKFVEFFI